MSGIDFSTSIKLGVLTIMNTVNSGLYGIENLNFFEMSVLTKSILIIFICNKVCIIIFTTYVRRYKIVKYRHTNYKYH